MRIGAKVPNSGRFQWTRHRYHGSRATRSRGLESLWVSDHTVMPPAT